MCGVCGFRRCPPPCPSYVGTSREYGRPIGQCDECGEYIYPNDDYCDFGKIMLCALCAECEDMTDNRKEKDDRL